AAAARLQGDADGGWLTRAADRELARSDAGGGGEPGADRLHGFLRDIRAGRRRAAAGEPDDRQPELRTIAAEPGRVGAELAVRAVGERLVRARQPMEADGARRAAGSIRCAVHG